MATIAWLIPTLIDGSGGHRTFLHHAAYLQEQGHRCRIYVENVDARSASGLRKVIKDLFGFDFDEVYPGWDDIQPADLAFATIWYSAKVVRDLPFPCSKAYFVQDYEAMFNPMGDGYIFAENSYCYGLYPITIGRWLPARLQNRFNIRAKFFDFCADLDTYRKLPGATREKSVCFIYQPEKPRRCPELGIEALGIVETASVSAAIQAADAGLKGAQVALLELRLADGLGGKGLAFFSGAIADVETAVTIACDAIAERGHWELARSDLLNAVVIPQLHGEMAENLLNTSRFRGRAGSL